MKKILIAFDGHHFSQGAFDFVCNLNDREPLLVIGVFLPVIDYNELLYSIGGLSGPVYYQDVQLTDTGIIQKNIDHFKALCIRHNLEFRVHPDIKKNSIAELKKESRFADLLVIDSKLFYENLGKATQNDYIEDILHKSECPVVLIPEKFKEPGNVILTYDGSDNAVYSLKQFSYMFPEFKDLETMLVYFGQEGIPDLTLIEELTARHYSHLNIYEMDSEPQQYFDTWLAEKGNSILVTGAYGRSGLSEMFKKSFISQTIHDRKVPVFIAHK